MPRQTTLTDGASSRDGRSERSERTREAVADAMLALIEEGDLRPTAPRVAERAGVSLRTVFHHYEDMESLYGAVADRQMARVSHEFHAVHASGELEARIDAFVAERARMHEMVTPVRRAGLLVEPFSAEIATRLASVRELQRTDAARVFATEFARRPLPDRRELVEAVAVASSWSTWEALRRHQRLNVTQAKRVMARTMLALLKED